MLVRRFFLCDGDRQIARAFGDAEIHGIYQRESRSPDDAKRRIPFARHAPSPDRGFGNDMPVDQHVVRTGSAHAERAPRVENLHMRGRHRHAEMQYHRLFAFTLENGAGHQEIAARSARRENLSRGDAISAVDFFRLARPGKPVRAAAGHQLDALRRHAFQQRFDRPELLIFPPPRCGCDQMGVHRKRQRGRSAVIAEMPQHRGEFVHVGATAAKLGRHAGREQPRGFEQGEIVNDELVCIIPFAGALCEDRPKLARDVENSAWLSRAGANNLCDTHAGFPSVDRLLSCASVGANGSTGQSTNCTK